MAKQSKVVAKRTKIVCTIGPASSSPAVISDMIKAGMNVARFNFSHGSHESNLALLDTVRDAAEKLNTRVALLLDLQGPKIRIGELPPEGIVLREGEIVTIEAGATKAQDGAIPVPYETLARQISKGDLILLDDGTKELEAVSVSGKKIKAKVLLGGTLLSRKGINVPTVSLVTQAMTTKDEADLKFGLQHDIDFVALSFVRQARDVVGLRTKIKRYLPTHLVTPAIIVKVEKLEAIDNFDAILAEADGIMIARGDLGLETPISSVPLRQKEIIYKCLQAGKPVVTATEMLGSMQFNPRPTRAEVSDVANAVLDHTDAVMLSGESAMGRFPVRAVKMMSEIIQATEASPLMQVPMLQSTVTQNVVAEAAVTLARKVSAAAIVIATQSGFSARLVSSLRPGIPVFVIAPKSRIQQQLVLNWGVTSLETVLAEDQKTVTAEALVELKTKHGLKKGNKVIQIAGLKGEGGEYHSSVQVVTV